MALLDTTTVVVDSIGRASFKAQMIGKDIAEACSTNKNDVLIYGFICLSIVLVALCITISIFVLNWKRDKIKKIESNIDKLNSQIKSITQKEPKDYYNIRKDNFIEFCYKVLSPIEIKDDKSIKEFDEETKKICRNYLTEEFVGNQEPTPKSTQQSGSKK